ncbi:MAG: hypothetical protein ACRDUV_14305 [Pseudonocardiaceae bacterium]
MRIAEIFDFGRSGYDHGDRGRDGYGRKGYGYSRHRKGRDGYGRKRHSGGGLISIRIGGY